MSATLAIAEGFLDAVASLSAQEQALTNSFLIELKRDPSNPGLSLERVTKNKKEKDLWAGRANSDLRVILYRDGGTWFVLHVDHHNPAWAWAEKHRITRHPQTGALQVVQTVEVIKTIERTIERPPKAPGLLDDHADDYLLSLGVPVDWLPTLRKVVSEDQLLTVLEKLPKDVGERLLLLASGELVTPPVPLSPERPATEAAGFGQHFYLVEDDADLRAALAAPLAKWIAFLHPTQRALAEGTAKGPTKVSGSAGTGKSVLLLHRARHLARKSQRVLLTSFVTTLCENNARNLRLFCTPAELEHITVSTVHKQALEIVRTVEPKARPADDADVERLLKAETLRQSCRHAPSFVIEEWDSVILAQGLESWDEYRAARRTGRGKGISAADRKALWQIFEATRLALADQHRYDWAGLARRAEALLRTGKVPPRYDAILVDELQDLRPAELRFLAALGADHRDQLLVAGDAGQRIYAGGFSLSSLGIDVRGRSHVLRVNYRTTEQIRRLADRLIDAEADDMDGGKESRRSTRSLLRGPAPSFEGFGSAPAETAAAVKWIHERITAGLSPDEIAVFARTRARLTDLASVLGGDKIASCPLHDDAKDDTAGVRLGTMHRAKGLEFKAVLVLDCGAGTLPNPNALATVTDPQDREDLFARERQLLYVSATRARDLLRITWHGQPSPFLKPVLDEGTKR